MKAYITEAHFHYFELRLLPFPDIFVLSSFFSIMRGFFSFLLNVDKTVRISTAAQLCCSVQLIIKEQGVSVIRERVQVDAVGRTKSNRGGFFVTREIINMFNINKEDRQVAVSVKFLSKSCYAYLCMFHKKASMYY